jgi:uncharacterized YigZ family protein
MTPSIFTISGFCENEINKIKGSRFIGIAQPVKDIPEALSFVEDQKKRYHNARHWCWAYRLGMKRESFRYQDDGEPSGTAGVPILGAIDAKELTDVLVLVVRYFGGTKLGTGGLVRAYGDAAREVLERAVIVELRIDRLVIVNFGYDDTAAVQAVAHRFKQQALESVYGEKTELRFSLPIEQAEAFARALKDVTRNRAEIRIGQEVMNHPGNNELS